MKNKYKHWIILPVLYFFFQGISPAVSYTQNSPGMNSFLRQPLPFPSGDSVIIYDDGSAESGWSINPGFTSWVGNYFPVLSTISGYLKSIDVYFINHPTGTNQQVSIDVFNSNYVLAGSSAPFMQSIETWIPVSLPDISFSGPFYVMVKWNSVATPTPYLGYDSNGPNAFQDFERYYDGTIFQKLSDPTLAGSLPGLFLVHAHAFLYPLSINEEPIVFDPVQVYPNPAKEFIEISSDKPIKDLKIFDLTGKIQINKPDINTQKYRIDLASIPEGMYLLSLCTREGNFIRKFTLHK